MEAESSTSCRSKQQGRDLCPLVMHSAGCILMRVTNINRALADTGKVGIASIHDATALMQPSPDGLRLLYFKTVASLASAPPLQLCFGRFSQIDQSRRVANSPGISNGLHPNYQPVLAFSRQTLGSKIQMPERFRKTRQGLNRSFSEPQFDSSRLLNRASLQGESGGCA